MSNYAKDEARIRQIIEDMFAAVSWSETAAPDFEGFAKAVRKDAGAGKATFVSLLGIERARKQAEMLIDQAIGHLHGFGQSADLLRAIARFAIERDR